MSPFLKDPLAWLVNVRLVQRIKGAWWAWWVWGKFLIWAESFWWAEFWRERVSLEYYSAIKKNEIMPFAATQMDLEIFVLSEVSQTKTNIIWCHLYVESKIGHKWTYLQNRNRLTDTEDRLVVAKGERDGRGMDWEFRISRCKLLYTEWINNKVLLYSTENYIQYLVINNNGKE